MVVTEHALVVALVRYLELDEDFHLDREEYDLIPESVARRFGLVPLKKEDGVSITIVMKNPLDMDAVDTVRSLTSFEIHKAVSTEERISAIIEKCYKEEAYVESSLQDIIDIEAGEGIEADLGDVDQLLVHANDAPVVRYVNLLLMEAVRDGASDIHFEPGENSCSVRLRVDGALHPVTPPPKSLFPAIVTRIKILSEMDIAERRLPLDGRFKFKFSGRVVDVRVSSMPLVFGEKVVMRILDKESLVLDLGDIGFEGQNLKRFKEILAMPNGVILLTGCWDRCTGGDHAIFGYFHDPGQRSVGHRLKEGDIPPVEEFIELVYRCSIREVALVVLENQGNILQPIPIFAQVFL